MFFLAVLRINVWVVRYRPKLRIVIINVRIVREVSLVFVFFYSLVETSLSQFWLFSCHWTFPAFSCIWLLWVYVLQLWRHTSELWDKKLQIHFYSVMEISFQIFMYIYLIFCCYFSHAIYLFTMIVVVKLNLAIIIIRMYYSVSYT